MRINKYYLLVLFLSLTFVSCNNRGTQTQLEELPNDSTDSLNSGSIVSEADIKEAWPSIDDTLDLNGLKLFVQDIDIFNRTEKGKLRKELTEAEMESLTSADIELLYTYADIAQKFAEIENHGYGTELKIYVTMYNDTKDTLEVPFIDMDEIRPKDVPMDKYAVPTRFFFDMNNKKVPEILILPNTAQKGYYVVAVTDTLQILRFSYKVSDEPRKDTASLGNTGEFINSGSYLDDGIYIKDYYLNKVKNK